MTRKDKLFGSFMEHEILRLKYQLKDEEIPKKVQEAEKSNVPIIKTIALIVNELESSNKVSDNALHKIVTKYLNNNINGY